MYQCKHVKAVCSSNVSKQNDCNVSSVSNFVKPLTVSKSVCSTIVSKSNIYNVSIVSQHIKPLSVSKSMRSCNVCNQNVHIVNSISHHTKQLSVNKSDCSCNVSKLVTRESVVVNISNSAFKRSFNVSSHKNGVTKSPNVRSILMTSIYFYITRNNFSRNKFLNYDRFTYHDVNIFNISRKCFI